MNSSAPGQGCRRPGYQRLDNQAACANRGPHRVQCLPSGGGRRLANDEACYAPRPGQRSVTFHQSFDSLVNPERFSKLKDISDHFGRRYDGRAHGKFATEVKDYTTNYQRPLNLEEQTRLISSLEAFRSPRHWSWRSLTTVCHSLTAAGVFTPRSFTDQAVTNAQTASLTGLLDAVRHQCGKKTATRCIDVWGITSLLWVMVKLIDNKCSLTPELQETVLVLLPHLLVLKEQFTPKHISTLMWAVAKLVDNSQELVTEFKELLVVLLPRVHALKDQFNAWGITNLLWAGAKLVDNGCGQTTELQEAVVSLLPRVYELKQRFIAQAVANLLWALAKLVDNGHELTAALQKAVAALLSRVQALNDQFVALDVANLLWAIAKLVDNGHELTPEINEAVVILLPRVSALQALFDPQNIANLLSAMAKLADHSQELWRQCQQAVAVLLPRVQALKAHFIPQEVSNLLWSMAKLVKKDPDLTVRFSESVVLLLPRVQALITQFSPREVSNLLWSMAKLVDSGQELTPELKRTVAALLPRVSERQEKFIAQDIDNLLWAAAKLVDHGLELMPEFNRFLAALLPHVSTLQGQFIVQSVTHLMWAMAKLVDSGYELTPQFKVAAAALLPYFRTFKEQFVSQHIATLMWAVAKLLDNGQELTPEYKEAFATLLPCVSILKDQFNTRGVACLLWAMGSLGDFLGTAATGSVIESMLCLSDKCLLFTQRELVMSLWGLLVCRARLYLANTVSEQNDTLEHLIDKLFSYLEKAFIDNKQSKSVMALAASWLGRACPVDPHYQTANSATQSVFYAQLQLALPSVKIEQEKSVHSLPPVDLLLPEHRIAIEIQGPSHYVGRDFQTRNGSTLLKTALLQKAGYEVLNIPVNHLPQRDSVKTYIDQIVRKLIDISVDDADVTGRGSCFLLEQDH